MINDFSMSNTHQGITRITQRRINECNAEDFSPRYKFTSCFEAVKACITEGKKHPMGNSSNHDSTRTKIAPLHGKMLGKGYSQLLGIDLLLCLPYHQNFSYNYGKGVFLLRFVVAVSSY